jgi:hypothetical protein
VGRVQTRAHFASCTGGEGLGLISRSERATWLARASRASLNSVARAEARTTCSGTSLRGHATILKLETWDLKPVPRNFEP